MLYKKNGNGERYFSISDSTIVVLAFLLFATFIYAFPVAGISVMSLKALVVAIKLSDWLTIAGLAFQGYSFWSNKKCKSCNS